MTRATADMDKDKDRPTRRPDVLKKINAESIMMIERGLLGDLPQKLRPVPPRAVLGRPNNLALVKPSTFRSSCLPIVPDSPISEKLTSSDESLPQLKKTFSFREKFSRLNLFAKDRDKQDKPKWKTIVEERNEKIPEMKSKTESENKSKKSWFFKNKDMVEKRENRPLYKRSKSFEFLPKAIEEEKEKEEEQKTDTLRRNYSYNFGSSDPIWGSNDSLERIANVYYENDKGIFLKSIREYDDLESPQPNSSMSTVTSASSGIVANILKTQSVTDLLEEFDKAVELFSENYMSDSEPYTKSEDKPLSVVITRRNASFSTLPSPKVLQVNRLSEVREDFKKELSEVISARRTSGVSTGVKTCRRGSVTDWFVLEDKTTGDNNKYRRAQKKPVNRVRRMSSTKYWITPEECAVYSREQRPPLVIPRITQYRQPRRDTRSQNTNYSYPEDTSLPDPAPVKSSVRQYDRLQDWSPSSERSRVELERNFSKANSDSPPFGRINKRLGGSTENLLDIRSGRPNYLQLPASSSGDSLDVEVRDRDPGYGRHRKSRSLVAPKHRMRSPVPAPRTLLHQPTEATIVLEGPVKRTKFSESGKKSKKNWMECYMILTPTALVFYKDQRTYQATKMPKPPGTPPSPHAPRAELVLPLRNAHLVHCIPMHTRRHARSLVLTVGYDQYLLQDDTEEGAKRWLTYIQNIIYKLGPPTLTEDYQTPQSQSSNTDLESLGRTPPVSRHSNRSKQKDEPVFGRNLDEVCPAISPRVPGFVVACVKEIEGNEENMCTDGLYRASGNLSQVQKIRLEIDQNNLSVIKNNTDIHVLTGSLKLFFRELKEPLIPCSMFDRVLAACSKKPREAKLKEFREIVQALPQCNRDTLKFLLEHLLRVTQYSERNRMHTANLAIVFGPTLLWAPVEQAHNIAIDCIQQNNVVDVLLTEFNEIFTEDKAKKKA